MLAIVLLASPPKFPFPAHSVQLVICTLHPSQQEVAVICVYCEESGGQPSFVPDCPPGDAVAHHTHHQRDQQPVVGTGDPWLAPRDMGGPGEQTQAASWTVASWLAITAGPPASALAAGRCQRSQGAGAGSLRQWEGSLRQTSRGISWVSRVCARAQTGLPTPPPVANE